MKNQLYYILFAAFLALTFVLNILDPNGSGTSFGSGGGIGMPGSYYSSGTDDGTSGRGDDGDGGGETGGHGGGGGE